MRRNNPTLTTMRLSLCVPVGSPLWQIQKDAKKHDNNVALAHCVNNSEGRKIVKAHKGLKPLVIKKVNKL